MAGYIARRLGWLVVVLGVVGVITFVLAYLLPSDPARVIAGPRATVADVARIRHSLGLDQPLPAQLAAYLSRLARGDLGHSYSQDRDVLPIILSRFPATLELALAGLTVELLIGFPLGVLAAARRGTRFDRGAMILAAVLVSAPAFWVGYQLLYTFAFLPKVTFGIDLLPFGGYEPFDPRYLILPALALGFTGAAYFARLTRTTMLAELHADYVRTARAKGVAEGRIHWRHAFRNAAPPLVTQIGLDLGLFLGGVVVIENVFSWPGIGKLAVDAALRDDIPLIMGTVLFATVCIVLANLAVDVAYAYVDPRIRHGT